MSKSGRVTSGDLGGVAQVFRALAEAQVTTFQRVYSHAKLRWPELKSDVKLSLNTHVVEMASQVVLSLSVLRPDGIELLWSLDVWIQHELVTATGEVYSADRGRVMDHLFERTEEAADADAAAELIKSMASRVCAERRFLES